MVAHVVPGLFPDGQEDALPLMVAGSVLVGFAEITESDGPVDGRDDLGETNVARWTSQGVAAADPALGTDQTGALEGQEDLFEIGLGEAGAFGDVLHRSRSRISRVQSQRQKGATGIVPSGRHSHNVIVGTLGLRRGHPGIPRGLAALELVGENGAMSRPEPILPDYAGANLCGVVPGCLLRPAGSRPSWFPVPLQHADAVVLLLVDGLGLEQLTQRPHVAPVLSTFETRAITSVVPSTTASALASLSTGVSPAEHGIIGYRMSMGDHVMNTLRWGSSRGDLRRVHLPSQIQPVPPFAGTAVPVVSRADLEGSAFTEAHLRGTRPRGWRVPSGIVAETVNLVQAGEKFVYAYYDGLDKTAHERGFGVHYDSELAFIDWMVGALMDSLPEGTTVAVTADHGQVDVGAAIVQLPAELLEDVHHQSGEGRFRWLHARRGRASDVLARAEELFSDRAWVVGRERIVDERWFGPSFGGAISDPVLRRFGDVALIPFADISFDDPLDSGPISLVCRHGSLTSAEMLVPLAARTVGSGASRAGA